MSWKTKSRLRKKKKGGKFVAVQEIPFPTKIQDDLRVETDGP